MDPLTAFGLAASVVQFVTFAASLVRNSIEAHNATSGLTDALDVEKTYNTLKKFSSRLAASGNINVNAASPAMQDDISALEALAVQCEMDCNQLLDVICKLKVSDGPRRRFNSFKAAFKALLKADEIKAMEERLAKTQAHITLHLCSISQYACPIISSRKNSDNLHLTLLVTTTPYMWGFWTT